MPAVGSQKIWLWNLIGLMTDRTVMVVSFVVPVICASGNKTDVCANAERGMQSIEKAVQIPRAKVERRRVRREIVNRKS